MNAAGARRYQARIAALTRELEDLRQRADTAERKLVPAGRLVEIALELEASPAHQHRSFLGAIVEAARAYKGKPV